MERVKLVKRGRGIVLERVYPKNEEIIAKANRLSYGRDINTGKKIPLGKELDFGPEIKTGKKLNLGY